MNPNLYQYINSINYHIKNNIIPMVPLKQQYGITKNDENIIRHYLNQKQNVDCISSSCAIKTNSYNFNIDDLTIPHAYNDSTFKYIDNHPYKYTNITKNSPYTFVNDKAKHIIDYGRKQDINKNVIDNTYICSNNGYNNKLNFTGSISNVDVESTLWHQKSTRNVGKTLGGININRLDDLYYNIQENSIFPFDFPRGGANSQDPSLYEGMNLRII